MSINIENYKNEILNAVKTKAGLTGNWVILDFFVNQPVQKEISSSLTLGGLALPLIVIMNQSTGEIKYFSLKFLLGDKIPL